MLPKLLQKRIKLPVTQEAFDALADKFLADNAFEVNGDMRKLFGALIQHSPETEDFFYPALLARRIRKQLANEKAFYLIYPERRAKKDEAIEVSGSPMVPEAEKIGV